MNDMAAIEARLRAALDRIEASAERLASDEGGDAPAREAADAAEARARAAEDELERLRAELATETAAHAQLAERLAAIRARQEQVAGQLEARVLRLQERAEAQEREMAELRQANADLRAMARKVRRAMASGVSDAALINALMETELKATQAAQAADRAELDLILAELTPIIEESAHV